MMEEKQRKKKELRSLPAEVLSEVFSYVPTREIYRCLFISKFCYYAIMKDLAWQERCARDLHITSLVDERLTWWHTYKVCSTGGWDLCSSHTNLEFRYNSATWQGPSFEDKFNDWVCLRGKKRYASKGVYWFDFEVQDAESPHSLCVGLCASDWYPTERAYRWRWSENQTYTYWSNGDLRDVTGTRYPFERKGQKSWKAWRMGYHVIGVQLDMERKFVHFWLDEEYQGNLKLGINHDEVWPVCSLLAPGTVRLCEARTRYEVPYGTVYNY